MKYEDRIRRRDLMKAGVVAMATSALRGQPDGKVGLAPDLPVQAGSSFGKANPMQISRVSVTGGLDKRIRLGFKHLLAERARILGGGGHTQTWGADQYGRWIYAVSQAVAYTGDRVPELEQTVRELIGAQQARGCWQIKNTRWGDSRGATGLTEYWELSHDAEALRSIKKLGEFYVADPPKPAVYFDGCIEPLVGFWRITGDARYLEAAEKMADYAITNRVLLSTRHIATHADLFLAVRGFVELFLATGKGQYLQAAQDLYARTLQQDMWVTGGISSVLDDPFETRDETCSVADWLRLSLKLWQATREPRYMEVAEHTLLNHLYFDQDHSGGFVCYRSVAPLALGGRDFVAWICCSMHGLRELLEAVKFIYTHDEDSIDVNLFTPSKAAVFLRNGLVRLEQTTAYPSEFTVRVSVEPERELSFGLRIRVPRWTRSFKVALNGEPIAVDSASGYATLARSWKPGDRVKIDFEPYFQLVPEGANGFSTSRPAPVVTTGPGRMDRAALTYGPLVLMFDPVLCPHQTYDWEGVEIMIPRGEDGELFLPRAEAVIPGRGEYSVSGMCFMTLGRNLKAAEGKPKSTLDFFQPGGSSNAPADSAQAESRRESAKIERPDPKDESWKLVFLVPVSEITDRWTPTGARMVPYEVRNNAWLLDKNQSEDMLARTHHLCDSFLQQRKLDTTGYVVRLAKASSK
jgi:DUF1680 family protein